MMYLRGTRMIETPRLFIKPLNPAQLENYIKADFSLERELGVEKIPRQISAALQEALQQTLLPKVADPSKNYLYSTLWTMILKTENSMVGDLCLVGEPNDLGEVEIGYGTYEPFRGRGLMCEAVGGMIQWLRNQRAITSVIASTEKANLASHRILLKNDFVKVAETDALNHWKLTFQV
jgi:RimJ/RimL family protein N-acetyltransferase